MNTLLSRAIVIGAGITMGALSVVLVGVLSVQEASRLELKEELTRLREAGRSRIEAQERMIAELITGLSRLERELVVLEGRFASVWRSDFLKVLNAESRAEIMRIGKGVEEDLAAANARVRKLLEATRGSEAGGASQRE